jgi:glycosyltransferase involved in cell wall biosynthesis
MHKVKVSVIINNYNYGSFIGAALDSVLPHCDGASEVIVVDDGSADNSRAVLEQYKTCVRVIFQENGGQASAINTGVRASQGDYICFLDADDWWAPGKLKSVVRAFEADPGVSLVYHRLQPVLSTGSFTLKPIPRTLCSGDLKNRLARAAGWWPFPMTSAVAVRRSTWNEIGEIPEIFRISADAWLVGVYPFLGRVVALPEALGFYRIHHNNNWHRPDDESMLRRRMEHWKITVEEINRFLEARRGYQALHLKDHFPYQIASARLAGAEPGQRLRLIAKGLRFAGEPNFIRRLRNVVREVSSLPKAQGSNIASGDRR